VQEKPLSYQDLHEIALAAGQIPEAELDRMADSVDVNGADAQVEGITIKLTEEKEMAKKKVPTVGEFIITTEELMDDTIDDAAKAGTKMEVTEVYKDGSGVTATVNGKNYTVATEQYKMAPVKKAAAKVVVPAGKIEAHEIIGQDVNKSILEVAIKKDLPILLIGETGTGKTSIIREAALARKQDWVRFSITGETTVDEFVGKYELENGQTVWKDGVLLDAMKTGKWLIADEINVALPEILFVLHSLLDDDKMVTVSQHTGEVVKPHKDFRFFATMNPTDEYAGTKELNKAFQSRFSIVLQLHYPPAAVEAKIVSDKTGVALEDATKMADVAVALRKAKADEKIFYTCSTRDLLHWGNLCDVLDPGEAFRVSILNKSNGDAKAILEIYTLIIKRYITLEQPGVTLTVDWFEAQAQGIIDERKKFEEEKESTRRQITQEIITKLTQPDKHIGTAVEAGIAPIEDAPKAVDVALEDVFSTNPF
jgi:cobaltochelatase CobS